MKFMIFQFSLLFSFVKMRLVILTIFTVVICFTHRKKIHFSFFILETVFCFVFLASLLLFCIVCCLLNWFFVITFVHKQRVIIFCNKISSKLLHTYQTIYVNHFYLQAQLVECGKNTDKARKNSIIPVVLQRYTLMHVRLHQTLQECQCHRLILNVSYSQIILPTSSQHS